MASGKTHDWVTWAMLPSVWLCCRWGFQLDWYISLLVTLGTLIGGLWLSPDLDTRSRPFYRWGLFRFIWWPYHWAVKHRSELSHGILFASWLRLLYLSAVLSLFYMGAYAAITQLSREAAIQASRQHIIQFASQHLNDILWLGVGIWLGSLLHIILDKLSSALKGKRRRR